MFSKNAFTSKFCWDLLLHVHEKSENKVEKDKKNLFIFHKALANIFGNQPPQSLKSMRISNVRRVFKYTGRANFQKCKVIAKYSLGNLLVVSFC